MEATVEDITTLPNGETFAVVRCEVDGKTIRMIHRVLPGDGLEGPEHLIKGAVFEIEGIPAQAVHCLPVVELVQLDQNLPPAGLTGDSNLEPPVLPPL